MVGFQETNNFFRANKQIKSTGTNAVNVYLRNVAIQLIGVKLGLHL